MKNVLAIFALLTLTACCSCMKDGRTMPHTMGTPKVAANAHQGQTCDLAHVSGMTCEVCATTVSQNLKKLPGVEDVAVSISEGTVKIYTDGSKDLDDVAVKHIIERSGYKFNSMKQTCE